MNVLIGFILALINTVIISKQYVIVQQNHYEIKRYFKYQSTKKVIYQFIQLIVLLLYFICPNILFLIVSMLLNIILLNKEKLKLTKRVKRYLIITFLFIFLEYIFLPFKEDEKFISLNSTVLVTLLITHLISSLIENLILKYYEKEAKKIMKMVNVIGITGSYGKTSTKNILCNMLERITNVSMTPKSYNTKVGIIKSVRENVGKFDEFFICEYGVDKKNGMDKLLKIVKPNISIITEIGNQHLLTFKNINNIKNEKIKLAKILNENEFAILNNDNKYLNEESKKLKCKVITYGIDNESDVMAKNIIMNSEGSIFDLYIDNKKIKRININLLGKHNISNTLASISVLKTLNYNLEKISELVGYIKPIEHRLEFKKIGGLKVIDDSFNSNEVGFRNAIDTIGLMKEKKIVITPGIIEQGDNSNKINYELGLYMADKIDVAILVEKNANIIKQGLLSKGFNKEKIIIKNNFIEAWNYVKENSTYNEIILIENDLPSIYLK